MKLYYSQGACSLSPHIVASEAGLPVELEQVHLAEHKTATGQDYMAVNPKGYVPALRLDDGSILTEGPAIVQYLADQKPASGLAPAAGTIERYRLQEWLTFIGTELHKSFSPLFNKASSDDMKNAAKANITKRLASINDQLASRQYLMGGTFTLAAALAFTICKSKAAQSSMAPAARAFTATCGSRTARSRRSAGAPPASRKK